jgi:hypothetical protein
MAGHMKHPPYPQWHMLMDYMWLVLFVIAGAFALCSSFRGKIALILIAILIAYSRLGLQSGRGRYFAYEYIGFSILVLLSLYNLLPKRKIPNTETADRTVLDGT